MVNANFTTEGSMGQGLADRKVDEIFALGTVSHGNENTLWLFGQAAGTVATGTCTVDAAFQITDAAGTFTADVAFADNDFGWVRLTAGAAA